ncbi:MAG: zinc-binding dehydrogenase [Rhodospirillales bacterium]|nr:zinc-binding dehydrogenase [Rhodospirillales bacterium]
MRGITFPGNRTVELATFPDPTPGPGEVVLQIKASGMCGSDLHYYRRAPTVGATRIIAGHEPCGVVVAVGAGVDVPTARHGARVMVHHYHGCTDCEYCRSGWAQMCQSVPVKVYGQNANGAHAPYMKVPASTLVPLDERLSFAAGAAISCGTGTAWGALERMGLTGRDTVAVFGQGPVGLSATMLAKAQGARVIALDISETRLATATAFGADFVVNPRDGRAPEAIRELTGGRGVMMALETSGAAQAGRDALQSVRPWGTICLVGLGSEATLSVAAHLRLQLRVMTSWTMSIQAQRVCAEYVADRGLDLDQLFTDRWTLDQASEAYASFDKQSGGKGVFLL